MKWFIARKQPVMGVVHVGLSALPAMAAESDLAPQITRADFGNSAVTGAK